MARFRKKPVVIEAVQWLGNMDAIEAALGRQFETYGEGHDGALRIRTLEGDHRCDPGDWIIRGVKGEFYPCKPDIFAVTYEKERPDA
jgi:hypothetical protein